jgi:hypothetical protein
MKHGCVAHRTRSLRVAGVRGGSRYGYGYSVLLVFPAVLEVPYVLDVQFRGTFHTQELARTDPGSATPGGVFPCDWDTLRTEGRGRAFPSMGSPVRSLVPVCQTPQDRAKIC